MHYPVVITEYNPEWPRLFAEEKQVLEKLFGEHILSIEHVGSTAVPGLAAKPIVDIMVGVQQLAEQGRTICLPALQKIGYHYVPELEQEMPERCFLYRGSGTGHSHHVHLTEPTTDFWIDHILFRDYLRKYPEAAVAYADLKRNLAEKYSAERAMYTKAKTDFIEDVLGKARAEKASNE